MWVSMRHEACSSLTVIHENAAGVFPTERHRLMLYYEAGAFECLGGLTTSGKGNV